jgi:hypothetical protein
MEAIVAARERRRLLGIEAHGRVAAGLEADRSSWTVICGDS